jgi:hypothetical protein
LQSLKSLFQAGPPLAESTLRKDLSGHSSDSVKGGSP